MKSTLYIIMRRDIPDMGPGKACAQAAHAQADFDLWANDDTLPYRISDSIKEWKDNRTFGRTIVLAGTIDEITEIVNLESNASTPQSGITTDPTYPWKNWYGETFVSEYQTAAWVFINDYSSEAVRHLVSQLTLMN